MIGQIIESITKHPHDEEFGVKIGKLYTDCGLPLDMALDRLDISKERRVAVLQGALSWLVQHKRNSGATEKAIDRTRKHNKEAMQRFLDSGEVGIY